MAKYSRMLNCEKKYLIALSSAGFLGKDGHFGSTKHVSGLQTYQKCFCCRGRVPPDPADG